MSDEAQTDPRTDEMKREMTEHFADYEQDYREADWSHVVYEDSQVVLIEDTKGYEVDEWAAEFDDFRGIMHDLADQLVDRKWTASYPIVFDKPANGGD